MGSGRGGKNRDGDQDFVFIGADDHLCPKCKQPSSACKCAASKAFSGASVVRVGRETKGRRGKGVTVITGLALSESKLAQLGKRLKQACGSGGTVRAGVIEIQGDHRDRLVEALIKLGYAAKRSGG